MVTLLWGLFGLAKISFCSTDLFTLALEVPKGPHQFSFCCFVPQFFVPLFCSTDLFTLALGVPEGPHQFCSTVFIPLTFCTYPSPNIQGSPPIFILLFLFCCFCSTDLFALALGVPEGPHQFCSMVFVSLTFLHLPITHCLRVPSNFYSTVFVPQFFFCESPMCNFYTA